MVSDRKSNEDNRTVYDWILSWSEEKRPLWLRDALRRIVSKGMPDESELKEIYNLCKKDHGDESIKITAEPLSQKHLPIKPDAYESISLASISNVIGVNRLATGQTLSFGQNGLTVIYGQNGSGKSGYTRILKKAGRSRHAATIIHDVYSPPPKQAASADITIIRDHNKREIVSWQNCEEQSEVLPAITVFDRHAALVYVKEKNDVWFRPFGLDIPDDLADICKKIKEWLTEEKTQLEKNRDPRFNKPTWSDHSAIGKVLSRLNHDTNIDTAVSNEPLSHQEKLRLSTLSSDLSLPPYTVAKAQRDYANQIDKVARYLEKIERGLSDAAIQSIRKLGQQAVSARMTATAAAHDAFSEFDLDHIGEGVWKKLWESARSYSEIAQTDGIEFPPTEGEFCVLCHQEVDKNTAKMMRGFENFVKRDTQAKALEHEKKFDEARERLAALKISVKDVSAAYKGMKEKNSLLARQLLKYLVVARVLRHQIILTFNGKNIDRPIKQPKSIQDAIAKESSASRSYAETIESPSGNSKREALRAELENLKDRSHFDELMLIAKSEISRLKDLKRITDCIGDTSTNSITRLGNDIADKVLTSRMNNRLKKEIKKLVGDRIRVKLKRSRGRFGSPQYEMKLESAEKTDIQMVLSEGELTCVSLSSYLTEIANANHKSALVFDDPISSLDHKWRARVAKRLVDEADNRQVIVFTHDMMFTYELQTAASEQQIPLALSYLARSEIASGFINEGLPWIASNVASRIESLREMVNRAKRMDEESYRSEVGNIYDALRATWERAIEEIVFADVIMRNREYIKPAQFHKVTALEMNDISIFKAGFKKCHKYVDAHDTSLGSNLEPPDHHEITRDINALDTWATSLRAKMNQVPPNQQS